MPGFGPQSASMIQRFGLLSKNLEIAKTVKKCENEQEYRIDGLVNNKCVYIFSLTEKFLLYGLENREDGYIVRPEIDPLFSGRITKCLQKVTSSSKVEYGFFRAKIIRRENEAILLKFEMGFAQKYMPKLISYATGFDYNHTIFKLFSSQPLSLHKGKKLNVGIIFFYKNFMLEKEVRLFLETLAQNACVIEMKEYDQESNGNHGLAMKKQYNGHVILIHKDYGILKSHMQKILIKSAHMYQE